MNEEARLTKERNDVIGKDTGADFLFCNLIQGNGFGAPKSRLRVFEDMYNKEQYAENKRN